ncbi:hypothetical protein SAV14893_047270 [Streptomyces avermitilis]|uniref:Uncharacterized protein n=1 Tax=Streptomyces avermitilis TaxID=33903 RepID=A0A4D4LXL6_STRAX|nr:hypothetical protein [Streptomyces avermitilis]GDY65334.1 hypothetical protein SAV14893_047270 [Streptomyces avermitilis]
MDDEEQEDDPYGDEEFPAGPERAPAEVTSPPSALLHHRHTGSPHAYASFTGPAR